MTRIRPKNWHEFQHYRDRNPTWIKLHKNLLDNFDFQSLPLASRALAPMLWLIASEDKDGWLDADIQKLAFRLRTSNKDIDGALKALISANFFELEHDASSPLADGYRVGSPERQVNKEQVERQDKRDISVATAPFDEFWKACPKKVAKAAAEKAWKRFSADSDTVDLMLDGMKKYATSQAGKDPQFIAHPATWLNQKRWLDDPKSYENGGIYGRKDKTAGLDSTIAGAELLLDDIRAGRFQP